MKMFAAVAVLTLVAEVAYAEVLLGRAEVRDAPHGKVLFTLEDGVQVACGPVVNHTQQIGVVAVVKSDAFWGAMRTKKRQPLYDLRGERIGETTRLVDLPIGKVPYGEAHFAAPLTGYVSWLNVAQDSLVERALEPIVDHKLQPLTLDDLRGHIADYRYQAGPKDGPFDTYVCFEDWMRERPARPRVALVFHQGNLVAVVYTRDLHFLSHDATVLGDGYKIAYVEGVDKPVAQALQAFLPRLCPSLSKPDHA